MKSKLFLLLLFAALIAIPSFAQKKADRDHEAKKKEFMEFKLNFLAEELELRDDQRKQFNEVYMQMETERRAIFKRIKTAEKSIKDNKEASEADYEKANSEISAAKADMVKVEDKYNDKFATFLTKKQLFKLKEAENKFTEKIQQCKDKRKHKKK